MKATDPRAGVGGSLCPDADARREAPEWAGGTSSAALEVERALSAPYPLHMPAAGPLAPGVAARCTCCSELLSSRGATGIRWAHTARGVVGEEGSLLLQGFQIGNRASALFCTFPAVGRGGLSRSEDTDPLKPASPEPPASPEVTAR